MRIHHEETDFGRMLGPEAEVDPWHLFVQLVPYLADQARERLAAHTITGNETWHSYRGFPVLAAGFGWDPIGLRSKTFITGNLKRAPKQKVCAEKRLLGQMRDGRNPFSQLVGIVVAGTTDPKLIADITDRPRATLPPCFDCYVDLANSTLPHVQENMPIVTVGLKTDMFQVCTPKELKAYYSGQETSESFDIVHPTMENWEQRIFEYQRLLMGKKLEEPQALLRSEVACLVLGANLE
jgi:hypothetical protein